MATYTDNFGLEHEGEVIDRDGRFVLVRELETGQETWVHWSSVDSDALDQWDMDNGQFGVGA